MILERRALRVERGKLVVQGPILGVVVQIDQFGAVSAFDAAHSVTVDKLGGSL